MGTQKNGLDDMVLSSTLTHVSRDVKKIITFYAQKLALIQKGEAHSLLLNCN